MTGCLVEVTRENERCLERRLGDAKRKKKRKEANEGKEWEREETSRLLKEGFTTPETRRKTQENFQTLAPACFTPDGQSKPPAY